MKENPGILKTEEGPKIPECKLPALLHEKIRSITLLHKMAKIQIILHICVFDKIVFYSNRHHITKEGKILDPIDWQLPSYVAIAIDDNAVT